MASTTSSSSPSSVGISAKHTIRSTDESRCTDAPFRLGPLDWPVLPFIPVAVVFVYQAPSSAPATDLIPITRLKRALSLLLDYYPHLNGRLHIKPDSAREIKREGTGAELFEARCSERLDAFASPGLDNSKSRILMHDLPGAGNELLAPFNPMEGLYRDPIFTVQHTRFACGSVALGVRVLHTVCDAGGFFQVMNDLAELYRGLLADAASTPILSQPPHIEPYMSEVDGSKMAPEELKAALDYKPELFFVEPPAKEGSAAPTYALPTQTPVTGRFMRFSSRELKALKEHATEPDSDNWISTFDAMSAHLYQCIYRARIQLRKQDPSVGELSEPNFLTPVNLRSRLGLPERYTGNALFTPYTSVPPSDLTGPLWKVAIALHELTRSRSTTSKGDMDATLRWIAAQPDKGRIRPGFAYGNGSLMISQWNKFDMYGGSVFEAPPVLVSPPFTEISLVDGLAYYLPTEGGEGDIGAFDVNLSLSEPLWEIMERDEELRRFRDA